MPAGLEPLEDLDMARGTASLAHIGAGLGLERMELPVRSGRVEGRGRLANVSEAERNPAQKPGCFRISLAIEKRFEFRATSPRFSVRNRLRTNVFRCLDSRFGSRRVASGGRSARRRAMAAPTGSSSSDRRAPRASSPAFPSPAASQAAQRALPLRPTDLRSVNPYELLEGLSVPGILGQGSFPYSLGFLELTAPAQAQAKEVKILRLKRGRTQSSKQSVGGTVAAEPSRRPGQQTKRRNVLRPSSAAHAPDRLAQPVATPIGRGG